MLTEGSNAARNAPPPAALAGSVVLGGLCGVGAKAADSAAVDWVSDLANYPGLYMLGLAFLAWTAGTAATAAARAALFFTALCLAYYAWSSIVLGFGGGRFLYAWTAVALTVVPLIAALLQWAFRRDGGLAGFVIGLAGAVPLADGVLRRIWSLHVSDALDSGTSLHVPQAVLDVVITGIIVGLLPRYRKTRLASVLLVLPLALAAERLIDSVRGAVGI